MTGEMPLLGAFSTPESPAMVHADGWPVQRDSEAGLGFLSYGVPRSDATVKETRVPSTEARPDRGLSAAIPSRSSAGAITDVWNRALR